MFEKGAVDYIEKPIDLNRLLKVLNDNLSPNITEKSKEKPPTNQKRIFISRITLSSLQI